ncbi:SEL1-like repeat protein [Escherichia coli]|nr:SEL1-like repeat protein [Escherichia coli]
MNCWEILGLQSGAEERDIKRRYAQLVKNCRPEDDPAAWQQLHDAYEQALRYDDEDQWQEEEEEQPINMSRGIVHPRPVMTFRAPNTFSGHPLPDVTIKSEGEFTWRAVLDMLCEENEATPEHAPMQLAKALSFLEKKDLSSRMCFEETLLLHLHRVFRPLLTLAAAQTFRWHLVAGSRQPVIQTEINESCLLYYRIEKQITPFFASNLSPLEEMENGKEMATIYQSLKDNEESLKWFDIAVLNKVAEFELSDNYMALLIECLSYSMRKEKMIRKWKLTERFNNLAMQHHSGYKKLLNAIKLKGLFYYPSSVYQSCLHAAEQGYSLAWYSLGKMYIQGIGVERDEVQAHRWFLQSAEQGYLHAQYHTARLYSGSESIPQDQEKALYWFTKAAKNGADGAGDAMYELGKYYLTNNDDPENNAEATQWLTGAAQRGRIEAIFLLAEMYLYGTKYIAKDENHALHWYEKAARLGATEAQHQTAAMYAQGTGTKIDNKQAWMWLTIAGNNNPWIEKDDLRCLMSEQDIQDAEQTAANCKRLLRI